MALRFAQGFVIALLAFPFISHAATAEELRAQITALLEKIQALQAQIGVQPGTSPIPSTLSGGSPAPAGSCPRVSRVLQKGDSGADVTRLQQFLALDPSVYPEGRVTGYYGDLTVAAVQRFQCKNRIVCDGDASSTGYGVAGPRTAAILALQCPDGGGSVGASAPSGPVSGFIRVSPTSGVSPLNVLVDATVNTAASCAGQTYTVDFGDGSAPGTVTVPAGRCAELQQSFTHAYTAGGTYQILLRSGTHQVSATVSVTQGTGTLPSGTDSLSGSPTSGGAPLTVTFSGVVNSMNQCNAGPYSINFGDGQTAVISVAGCVASSFQVPHVYNSSGTYTARLYRGNPAVNVASMTVTVGGSVSTTGGAFSVEGGVNGNPLVVRTQFDLASSCSRYDLDWGDNSPRATQSEGSCASGISSRSLTHTYASPGSYTITLRRGSSLNFSDTAAVTIVQ